MQNRIEYIIARYLSGETDSQENKELLDWLKLSDANRKMFFETKLLWNAKYGQEADERELSEVSMNEVWRKIKEKGKGSKRVFLKRNLYRAGAIAAVLLGAIIWITVFYQKTPSPVLLTYSNTLTDSIMRIVLEDQTVVWLKENTTLKVLSFNEKQREVELDGCAFFEVTHNAQRPFTVSKDNYHVRVLGTSFGVNTQYEDEQYETVLLEGSVRIERGNNEKLVTLVPGQQAVYSDEQGQLNINNIDAKKYTLWRFGIVSLTDVSISEILEHIESVYHVKIAMNTAGLEDNRYNFFFRSKKDIEESLKYIYYLTGRQPEILHFD